MAFREAGFPGRSEIVPDTIRYMTVRVTNPAQAVPLGQTLALAYEVNPLVRWMLADDLSPARLGGLFASLVGFGLRYGLVYRSAVGDGAAIWFPPTGDDLFAIDESMPSVETDTAERSSGR